MNNFLEKLSALIDVKSLTTLAFVVVFAVLSLTGVIVAADFMTVFLVIITYYFSKKDQDKND